MAKKKDGDLTLIQITVATKKRVKKYAKGRGVLLNRMVDQIIHEYLNENEGKKQIY